MKTSWMDRVAGLEGWLTRVSVWVWFPAGWVLAGLLEAVPRWIDGSLALGTFDRYALSDPFYIVAPLAAYAHLTRVAQTSFDRFRPALDADDDDARRRLSSVPPRMAIVTLAIGGVIGVTSYFTDPGYASVLSGSTITAGIFYTLAFIGFGMHVVLGALIVRQLSTVARLHRRAKHIDLYLPDPLHAFARLTARAGAIFFFLAMYSAATDPTTFTNPVWRSVFVVAMLLAAAAFFLPLAGLSRRLRAEKSTMHDAAAARVSALTAELHDAIDSRRLDEISGLQAAIAAVGAEQDRIKKTSTWPWETATVRGFATTLLLPTTTWFITSLLSKSLGL